MSEKEILPQNQLSPTTFPFGPQEYRVYMMLLHQHGTYNVAESGTQATGFINKCLQIHARKQNFMENFEHHKDSNDASAEYRSVEMHSFEEYFPSTQFNSPGVYFATSESRTDERIKKEPTSKDTADRVDSFAPFRGNPREITVGNVCCSKKAKGFFSSLFRATGTQVDDCSPCCKRKTSRAAASNSEESCQNMLGTISHIRLGPPPPCPAHGSSCTGPCKAKSVRISPNEERARIKTSTVSNSRRGVFELVIRKLTGAPLARNELLLEWTPPPSRGPCCALPCPGPGAPCLSKPSCGAVKSKMIICKPNPCTPPKKSPGCCQPGLPPLCQHGCRAPCSSKPCLMCRPCVRPFSPPPCRRPSAASPCPAKCMRTCRVGKGKLRKKSTVKIRPHPKHKSPCLNRAPQCPVVRARSQPDRACCDPPCGPRLCRSTARCSGCRHPC